MGASWANIKTGGQREKRVKYGRNLRLDRYDMRLNTGHDLRDLEDLGLSSRPELSLSLCDAFSYKPIFAGQMYPRKNSTEEEDCVTTAGCSRLTAASSVQNVEEREKLISTQRTNCYSTSLPTPNRPTTPPSQHRLRRSAAIIRPMLQPQARL